MITRDKVLVVGGAGFVGSHVARRLLAASCDVWLGLKPTTSANRLSELRLPEVRDLREAPGDLAAVVYAAGPSRGVESLTQEQASQALDEFQACLRLARNFVLLSSHSAYGAQPPGPILPSATLRPQSVYGRLCAAREELARAYGRVHVRPVITTVLRLSTVYGPQMRDDALVNVFVRAARAGQAIRLQGGGHQRRSFVHVTDVAAAVVAAIRHAAEPAQPFNVATDSCSVRELAVLINSLVRAAGGPGAPLQGAGARAHEEGDLVLDAADTEQILGCHPTVRLPEGLVELVRE